jgi:hypothetical protein
MHKRKEKHIKTVFSAILCFLTLPIFAENTVQSVDTLIRRGKIKNLLPKGYRIIDSKKGDLNLDAYPDQIMIIEKDDNELSYTDDELPMRKFLILTGNADNTYTLAASNNQIVEDLDDQNCRACYGAGFSGIKINKGTFIYGKETGGTSSAMSEQFTFTYDPKRKNWFLKNVLQISTELEYDDDDHYTGEFTREKKYYNKKKYNLISISNYLSYN